MSATDVIEKIIIPLIAAFIGAVLAFRYQRTLELRRDKRHIIQSLMVYRNVGARELDWIKALNAIDVVFNNDKGVKALYRTFLAQTAPPLYENGQWIETFYILLHEMAKCSDYKNLSLQDVREFYAPEGLALHYPNMNRGSNPSPPPSAL